MAKIYGEVLAEMEREYLEHKRNQQPPLPAGSRDWQYGDIDWSCYADWVSSMYEAKETLSLEKQKVFDEAIDKLKVVVSEIVNLDPRCSKPGE